MRDPAKHEKSITQKPVHVKTVALSAGYESVLQNIAEFINTAKQAVARNVNALMTASYWEIGRRIVEAEQKG